MPPPRTSRSSPAPAWASTTSTSPPPPRLVSWSPMRRPPTSPAPPSSPSGSSSPAPATSPPANEAPGRQVKRSVYGGVEVLDKVVGIVGFGRIGQLVAERLKGFGVGAHRPRPYANRVRRPARRPPSPASTSCSESSTITIHPPKTPETIGLIGKEALAGQTHCAHRERCPWLESSTRTHPQPRRQGASPAPASTSSGRADDREPLFEHESVVVTSCTWARPHRRGRERPASPLPSPCPGARW